MSRFSCRSAVALFSLSSLSLATRSFFSSSLRHQCVIMAYSVQEHGTPYTKDYKLFLKNENGIVSSFHDVPLLAEKENHVFNMVVEVPRWTNAKMEISTKEKMNPITQDIKKGKVRFVNNVFPYKGYMWNYGALPQTWEDPNAIDEHTGMKGDGDPIDVCEIGYKVAQRGDVKQVKVLGVLSLIDEGETDWKVIAIDINDPLASKLNDIDDVRRTMPGLLEATHEWLKTYKIPAGSPANVFGLDGEFKDREFAIEVIMQTHDQWKTLVSQSDKSDLSQLNVSVENSDYKISQEEANSTTENLNPVTAPADFPDDIDMMYYLTEEQKNAQ